MDNKTMMQLDSFIDVAAKEGVSKAIELHGKGIDKRELEAMKKLSPSDLMSLSALNSKIASAAKKGGLAADWTCGALC